MLTYNLMEWWTKVKFGEYSIYVLGGSAHPRTSGPWAWWVIVHYPGTHGQALPSPGFPSYPFSERNDDSWVGLSADYPGWDLNPGPQVHGWARLPLHHVDTGKGKGKVHTCG